MVTHVQGTGSDILPSCSFQAMGDKGSYRDSGSQCNLQVMTDGESSDASITAESVSSSSYKLHRRDRRSVSYSQLLGILILCNNLYRRDRKYEIYSAG